MTTSFRPCSNQCKTPEWCFEDGGCGADLQPERHDEEPNDFLCPEDLTCESQETCDAIKFCHKQLQHPTQTEWYRRISRLQDIIGDHQIWLLSGDMGDFCIVERWQNLELEPTADEKLRMLAAETWLRYVADRRGDEVAYGWFVGNNFDGYPAHVALRENKFYLLEESAKEYAAMSAP